MKWPIILLVSGFIFISSAQLKAQIGIAPSQVFVDTSHYYMTHSYNVLKYTLEFDLYANYTSPSTKAFQAKEKILFKIDSSLNSIWLNAVASSLDIDSVGLSATSFSTSGDTLYIQLNRTYLPGETAEISISFNHKNVTDHAFYTGSGYVFTDFPPEGARKVFPCWDRPSDKALTDITVKVPINVRLGSTGSLNDSTIIGDSIWYHWVSRDPVSTYLITLTSKTNFLITNSSWPKLSNPSELIPVRLYYKSGENLTIAQNVINPITDYFSSKFGDYPFEKIGFATLSSSFPWGGMENQTMVNLMPNGYNNEALIAHEHAHQWFGNLITCGTWADVWLNEGFGTYCESLWRENSLGYDDYIARIKSLASVYLLQNPGYPIYNPLWAIHTPPVGQLYNTAITYNKGACVLHQLRGLIGDSLFFDIMRTYSTDTNFTFGNAVTEDFITVVNQVTGIDYQWFFDQWVYAPNHPVYDNRYEFILMGGDNWKVNFLVNQVQNDCGLHTTPVDIKIAFADATDTIVRMQPESFFQMFTFDFLKQPVSVVFDPLDKIVLKEATTIVGMHKDNKISGFKLEQNHPNPFGKTTEISFSLPFASDVNIQVINSEGKTIQEVVNEKRQPGKYNVSVNSQGLTPGTYFYKMTAGRFEAVKKMIFLNQN